MARRDRPKMVAIYNEKASLHAPRAGLAKVIAHIAATPRWVYGTETLQELDQVAAHVHAIRPEILVVNGGDGTLKSTMTAVCRNYEKTPTVPLPLIWLNAVGTENVTADDLGITGSNAALIERAKRIRAKIDAGLPLDVAHRHALKYNDEFGMLFGSGVPVNLLGAVYKHAALGPRKRILKALSEALWPELAALATFRKSPRMLTRPVHAKITLPQGSDPPVAPLMTHTAILAGTVSKIGLGFRGLPEALSKPGHLMLRSTDLGFWGLLGASPNMLMGLPHPSIFDAVVPFVHIDYAEPTDVTLDGEIYHGRTYDRLACGPLISFITG